MIELWGKIFVTYILGSLCSFVLWIILFMFIDENNPNKALQKATDICLYICCFCTISFVALFLWGCLYSIWAR